ncbi:hypothetical protein LOZ66_006314 [Ophidiomyces ophidiicola]|nr:hypothetical protein LOZ66_006314 [Ophidiomyces ophidiicola]
MATDWETERGYLTQQPPSPPNLFYKTPPASGSRHSTQRRDSSSGPASSPLPFSANPRRDVESRHKVHLANDESISPLDPRRFTPTLHASLVAEILSLRRDLDAKTKEIDTLESSLESARSEAESLQETISKNSQETRSLKRQLQLLEGGSNSAITELANERDEALENISDVRKRLDISQKKLRTQAEQIEQTQAAWDQDKQHWDDERRTLERKVHVIEGRLKLVLNEIAAAEAFNENNNTAKDDGYRRDRANTGASDATSIRSSIAERCRTSTPSMANDRDVHNFRYSIMSQTNGNTTKSAALNLADELAFDEEEEDMSTYTDDERPESRDTLPEENCVPNQSHPLDLKARKILGLSFDGHEQKPLVANGIFDESDAVTISNQGKFEYKDMGIQYTPPPSPKSIPEQQPGPVFESRGIQSTLADTAVDQTDKSRLNVTKAGEANLTVDCGTLTVPVAMVSSPCQTTDELLNNATGLQHKDNGPVSTREMISSGTQTDSAESPKDTESRLQMPIPMIAVHPPGSSPPSPRNSVVLPPATRSAASQTEVLLLQNTCSSAMQTEEIRVDKRVINAAAALLPSAMPDKPFDSEVADAPCDLPMTPYCPPPKSPKRKLRHPLPVDGPIKAAKQQHGETYHIYPGNNDNGPLTEDEQSDIRRPFRSSSLFAGFDDVSDDGTQRKGQDLFGDDEFLRRPMASYTLKSGRLVSKEMPSILDHDSDAEMGGQCSPKQYRANGQEQQPSGPQNKSHSRRAMRAQLKQISGAKEPDMRRAAMIFSSTAMHQSYRPRSPSTSSTSPQNPAPPPFPVPTRFSSRKPRGGSDGAQSPTPYGNGSLSGRMGDGFLRKSRSAAVVRKQLNGHQSPALSTSSMAPDSPLYPPMPLDEITAPRNKQNAQRLANNHMPPSRALSHSRKDSTATTVQPTSVVDAIAQTMVGGWMWKYVRRRKSFGMTETSKDGWEIGKNADEAVAANTGVRHKRWVWLAPYERAIMWSSKQPTSGPALLGKSGRKLIIQSVLDVKDENPMPKGASPQNHFRRSILILTPQRALKFTAMTLELHCIWLTALSFLSHSSMALNDLAALPPIPQEEYAQRQPTASLRRNPIRDSIRVAKSKTRSSSKSKRSFTPQPAAVPELPHIEDRGDEPVCDAADPPFVPRFASHTRKRSNTAPRPVPAALRTFSSHAPAPSTHSATTAGSSELHSPSSIGPSGLHSGQSSISRRMSEASGATGTGTANFFDAIGTVRMEAFVDGSMASRRRGFRNRHGGKRDPGLCPQSPDTDFTRSDDASDIFSRNDDPFKGF